MKKILSMLTMITMSFFLIGTVTVTATATATETTAEVAETELQYPGMEIDFFDLEVMEDYLEDLVAQPGEDRIAQEFLDAFEEKGYEVRMYHSVGDEGEPYISPFMLIYNDQDRIMALESEHFLENMTEFIDIESFANLDDLSLSEAYINPVDLTAQELIFYNEDQTIAVNFNQTSTVLNLEEIDPDILQLLEQLNGVDIGLDSDGEEAGAESTAGAETAETAETAESPEAAETAETEDGASTTPEETEMDYPGMAFNFFRQEEMVEYLDGLVAEPGLDGLASELLEIFLEKDYKVRIYNPAENEVRNDVGEDTPEDYIAPFMLIINEQDRIVALESRHIYDHIPDFVDLESFSNLEGETLSEVFNTLVESSDQEAIFYNEDYSIAINYSRTPTILNLEEIDSDILDILEEINDVQIRVPGEGVS